MLGEFEKRAADLAVSRYGASPSRVERVMQTVAELKAQGQSLDLLESLLKDQVITPSQARELRQTLDRTVSEAGNAKNKSLVPNGEPALDIFSAPTLPPDSNSSVQEGSTLDVPAELRVLGEYRLLRRLGEGGMGAVHLAYQESQKKHVAIKILSGQQANNQTGVDRFYRGAKSGSLLNHPNIVRNLTIGQDKTTGLHYLVMEYVDGPSVEALLEKYGRLTVGDAVYIILDIARALEHAHSRNIVHRDIKPGNILISQSGVAKLADLGLAKRTDEASHLTATRQGFGTPYYMPYEQAVNAKFADARCDIYALGATFYHLLVGDVPFSGSSSVEIVEKKNTGKYVPARVLNPELPRVLDTILARMLAREPRHRYQTASELIVDLERSRLAARVPSFIDPQKAMEDPVVRQRLNVAMQATAMEMNVDRETDGESEYWYLRYRDPKGTWRKVKLTVAQIIHRFQQGKMPNPVEVSPHPNGDFRPLLAFNEFQELTENMVRTKTPEESSEELFRGKKINKGQSMRWLALGTGVTIFLITILTVILFLVRGH